MTSLLGHPLTKALFLVSAVIAGAVAVIAYWGEVAASLAALPVGNVLGAVVATLLYVLATMLCWRASLWDLGASLPGVDAGRLFFLSQIGKYIPGGVWNVVAVGEMGRDKGVPRRTSLSAMLVFWLVSVTTGLVVGTLYLLTSKGTVPGGIGWVVSVLVLGLVVLTPPVLRRLLTFALRALRRPPLVRQPTTKGLVVAVSWAVLGWAAAGMQVWLIASPMASASVSPLAAVSGYALAWTAGFLVVVAPAGAGVREVVLGGLFSGSLSTGAVLTLVLISRLLITLVDFALAGLAMVGRGQAGGDRS